MPRPARSPAAPRSVAAIAVASALTLTACAGGQGKSHTSSGAASASPKPGGSLTISVVSDLNTADPFGAAGNQAIDSTRMNALYDSLLWSEPGTGKPIPQIALSLVPDPGAASWTLKLRPGMTFTDGTPYDAAAVKWTWDEHKNPERRSLAAGAAQAIRATTVVDPTTLTVDLVAPNAHFDRVVATSLAFIPSPTAFQKDPQAFKTRPVGAGPFTLADWVRGSAMTVQKNPKYWQGPERPYLDKITFQLIGDSEQSLNAAASGQVDAKVSVSAVDGAKARGKGLNVVQVSGITGESIMFNNAKPPFDDVRARRAVALALNPEDINKVAFGGQGTPAKGMFPDASPLVAPGVNTNPAGDRAEAQRLLDELASEGKPLDFAFTIPQNPQATRTAEYIQTRLATLRNISVRLEPLQVAAFVTAIRTNRSFQASLQNWLLSDPEPSMYGYLQSTGASNYLGYKNPAADAALERGRIAVDPAQRQAAYTDLARLLQTDVPVWTYQQGFVTAYFRNGVAGVVLTNDGMLVTDRIGRAAG
jgi:peptide/nickel transport system substrate-binding protein